MIYSQEFSLLDPKYRTDKQGSSKGKKTKEKNVMSPVSISLSLSEKRLKITSRDDVPLVLKDLDLGDIFGV